MPFAAIDLRELPPRRLILALSGGEKCGKTDFALRTAPEPVYHFCLDPNGEAIARKLARALSRDIRIARYGRRGMAKAEAADYWAQFQTDVLEACRGGEGTLVWDTETEVWEMLRVARLGKTDGVLPRYYGPLNAEMRSLYAEVYDSPLSLIALRKLKDEYVNDKSTGQLIPAGWGDTPYTVQANARAYFVQGEKWPFVVQIENNALNFSLAGQTFATDSFSFADLLDLSAGE